MYLNGWRKMAWFSLAKLALNAGNIYIKNVKKQKWLWQMHSICMLKKWLKVREEYQGKLLEARQSDWKDEFVLIILFADVVIAWAVISDDPTAMDKVKLFFECFQQLPSWFTNLWILVVASIYGIKGTQIFRNGKK